MIEYYSKLIADWGIDIFRQDARAETPPDTDENRVGMNGQERAKDFTNSGMGC